MSGRAERLASEVASRDLDMLLVTHLTNVRWLTGFRGSNGAVLCGPGVNVFMTDFRYTEIASRELSSWEVVTVKGEWTRGLAAEIVGRAAEGSARVAYEDAHLTVRSLRKLEAAVSERDEPGGVTLAAAGDIVESMRRVKGEAELAGIAVAAELADSVFRETVERGLAGRTEREVARFACDRLRDGGAEPSFPPIVAAAENGARPHALPGDREIASGELVVFDMGAELDGFCSDCTRTVATGKITEEERSAYEAVLSAQLAALDSIRAGTAGKAADAVARGVIEAAGYGEHFGHGLGHGVGLEVHEAPRLSPLSEDTLGAGDVVTIEPGVYLAGRFGVRIEDLVVVTEDGHRNLTGLGKELGAPL